MKQGRDIVTQEHKDIFEIYTNWKTFGYKPHELRGEDQPRIEDLNMLREIDRLYPMAQEILAKRQKMRERMKQEAQSD